MSRSSILSSIRIALIAIAFLIPSSVFSASPCCTCTSPTDPTAKICLTSESECSNLPSLSKNDSVKTYTCTSSPDCKTVAAGGTCTQGPVEEMLYKPPFQPVKPANENTGTNITSPDLNVKIPGLVFATKGIQQGDYLLIPFFAQYVAAAYKFLITVSAIAAAIMIVYGGFLYVVGATGAKVRQGKGIIVDALIGLVLVMGAYVILSTVNPATLELGAIKVPLIKPDPQSYMGGRFDAPGTLSELGVARGTGSGKDQKIPMGECPGRNPSYKEPGEQKYFYINGAKVLKSNYTLCSKGRCLDQKTIDFYLKEQQRSGVPAAVIMAQIVTEAGVGAVFNLADGGASSLSYNYGGIGCTQRDMPQGSCAHLAFGPLAFEPYNNKKPHPLPCSTFNSGKELGAACVSLCQNSSRDSYGACGDKCQPIKSHAAVIKDGVEVWIPSVQCSRKFKSPQDFLDSHLGFVKPCLPYQDSVYKFAYCVGASTYAGVTGAKGLVIAEIIERNCLCDPSTDSLGCARNKELEDKLAKNIIKKRNLYDRKFILQNGDIDAKAITEALLESTQGLLKPTELLPQNDVTIPPDQQ